MRAKPIILFLFFTLFSCKEGKRHRLPAPFDYSFELAQRSEKSFRIDTCTIVCYIDDITRHQVRMRLTHGNDVLLSRAIRQGDTLFFNLDEKSYSIECTEMKNKLLGKDYAKFRLRGTERKLSEMSGEEQIETLLIKVESSEDVIFIRNGEEHKASEAADHLRSKWAYGGDRVNTLELFIEHIGSRSSTTGEVYKVKLPEGEVLTAEEWYTRILEE